MLKLFNLPKSALICLSLLIVLQCPSYYPWISRRSPMFAVQLVDITEMTSPFRYIVLKCFNNWPFVQLGEKNFN